LVVKGGTPVYVRGFLEANHISIPEVETTAQAIERVRQQIHDGADGIKILANSIEQDGILTMPLDLAKVIVDEAHRARPVLPTSSVRVRARSRSWSLVGRMWSFVSSGNALFAH